MKSKNPENMTTEKIIELADEIKRGMTKRFLGNINKIKKAENIMAKKTITKKEAIMLADRVKSGMSIKVLNDLKELQKSRPKVLLEIQS
ncbi:MAG: hypothetical protein A2101_00665 [Spirochaetes bacterium GWF2_52_7]|nr:MAG: hypothetical protein A2101_00665 [Spirochaetes bacterium GWF2_52_7]